MGFINFVFKKERKFGDLFSDYLSLLKKIFKHFNSVLIILTLPLMAIIVLFTIYFIKTLFTDPLSFFPFDSPLELLPFIGILILVVFIFYFVSIMSSTEYMRLLESTSSTDFKTSDVYTGIKQNFKKYILFFLASIPVMLLISIPLSLITVILILIPLVGGLIAGVLFSMVSFYFYTALMLYIEDRSELWPSFSMSYRVIKKRIFEYGAAIYLFQFVIQIILAIFTIIPIIVIFITSFNVLDNVESLNTFAGKILLSTGSVLFGLIIILVAIYIIGFHALAYYSLIEENFHENAMDNIDEIGTQYDEF